MGDFLLNFAVLALGFVWVARSQSRGFGCMRGAGMNMHDIPVQNWTPSVQWWHPFGNVKEIVETLCFDKVFLTIELKKKRARD